MSDHVNEICEFLLKANLGETAEKVKREYQLNQASKSSAKEASPQTKSIIKVIEKSIKQNPTSKKENKGIFQNFMTKIVSKESNIPTISDKNPLEKALGPQKFKKLLNCGDFIKNINDTSLFNKSELVPKKPSNTNVPKPTNSPIIGKHHSTNEIKNPSIDSFSKKEKKNEDAFNQLDSKMQQNVGHIPSIIHGDHNESSFLKDNSFVFPAEGNKEGVDEYKNDDDQGFDIYEADEGTFEDVCKELATKYGFPARSIYQDEKAHKHQRTHQK